MNHLNNPWLKSAAFIFCNVLFHLYVLGDVVSREVLLHKLMEYKVDISIGYLPPLQYQSHYFSGFVEFVAYLALTLTLGFFMGRIHGELSARHFTPAHFLPAFAIFWIIAFWWGWAKESPDIHSWFFLLAMIYGSTSYKGVKPLGGQHLEFNPESTACFCPDATCEHNCGGDCRKEHSPQDNVMPCMTLNPFSYFIDRHGEMKGYNFCLVESPNSMSMAGVEDTPTETAKQ